jgi:GYF domain 2
MSNRSWFFAAKGQQQGPYPEAQLRALIVKGAVTADTLVWSEGMADWQKAGNIPGLFSGVSGALASTDGQGGGALTIDVGLWELLGRGLVFVIGFLLVIPAPWVATSFYRWIVSRLRVPQRPNLAFAGQVGDIWYVFGALGLLSYSGLTGIRSLRLILIPVQGFLSWMTLRWIAANFSSDGRQLPTAFKGSALTYVGWYVLMYLSFITVVGWAWVITAWMRWICRNIEGTQREILFVATGLEMLWRTLVFAVGAVFIIPIPWVMRWYTTWYVSQFALVERAP